MFKDQQCGYWLISLIMLIGITLFTGLLTLAYLAQISPGLRISACAAAFLSLIGAMLLSQKVLDKSTQAN